MCFTYRILEPMDSNIHLSMFSPALEKATSKVEVQFPAVYCLQSTPSETVDSFEDSNDSSDDEFFDALTDEDFACIKMAEVEAVSPIEEDWLQEDWPREGWPQGDWAQEDWAQEDRSQENCSRENTDTQTEKDDTSGENDHPLAGWHSERLAKSSWTDHSYIDKTDHIDTWARHTDYHLARCNWCVFPESAWPKPETDCWGAPELRLITPEGDVCWLDDPTDYESLPWEREVAEERNRILNAIW